MKKFRTIVSLIAMVLAGVVGFFLGSALESAFGGAILFSSHILDVVERVCNKIAVIKDGKLVYEGATEEATRLNNLESFFMELNHADAISSL